MKPINDFSKKFNTTLSLDPKLVVKQKNRYYLLNQTLKSLSKSNFFHAGTYLGKIKNRKLYPSLNLLHLLSRNQEANKTIVNPKAEWLFICGRDILKQGITAIYGPKTKNTHTLIQNQHNENIGYGIIMNSKTIKNITDIGDLLRREKHKQEYQQ